jgi:hypothetical protein
MAGMWLFSLLFDIYEVREDWKAVGMKGIQISEQIIILALLYADDRVILNN